jgi:hypothetical protein
MSNPQESSPHSQGYNPAAQGIERGGTLPLTEAERAVMDTLVLGIFELYDGSTDKGRIAYQTNANDEGGRSQNFRNQLWHEVSLNVVNQDVIAELEYSEQTGVPTRLTREEGAEFQIPIEEDKSLLIPATRRMAWAYTKTGVLVFEEREFPAQKEDGGIILKRIMSARLNKQ